MFYGAQNITKIIWGIFCRISDTLWGNAFSSKTMHCGFLELGYFVAQELSFQILQALLMKNRFFTHFYTRPKDAIYTVWSFWNFRLKKNFLSFKNKISIFCENFQNCEKTKISTRTLKSWLLILYESWRWLQFVTES